MDIIFEILARLINQKNGAVTESMTDRGIIYKVNYGVSLHTIKKVAEEYAPDHELAQQLYERDEREAKLAAVFIEDPQKVTAEQMERWAKDFINVELAEVACSQLFYKTPYALPYSYEWCTVKNIYLQKAGWTMIARISQQNEATNVQLVLYLGLAECADLSQAVIQQAVISALVKFGTRNEELRQAVMGFASRIKNEGSDKQLVADEIISFLSV